MRTSCARSMPPRERPGTGHQLDPGGDRPCRAPTGPGVETSWMVPRSGAAWPLRLERRGEVGGPPSLGIGAEEERRGIEEWGGPAIGFGLSRQALDDPH